MNHTIAMPRSVLLHALLQLGAPIIEWRKFNLVDTLQDFIIRLLRPLAMAGFLPDEGESLLVDLMCKRILTDRPVDLEMGLFVNATVDETITEATITEPTGTGYARQTLTDASWTGSGDNRSYPQITFTGGAGGWSGGSGIQGYFISTTAGGTQRLIAIEDDTNGPYTINENDTYKITPTITGQ